MVGEIPHQSTGRHRRIPNIPTSIIPHNSAYGKISSPRGTPRGARRARIAADVTPRLRVVRQVGRCGVIRSKARKFRPSVSDSFPRSGDSDQRLIAVFERFEDLAGNWSGPLSTETFKRPHPLVDSTAAGGQGLDTEGRRRALTGGNERSKHGRAGLDSRFSWDDSIIKIFIVLINLSQVF